MRPFSTAAAAGGRNSCRTSHNFAAIGALLDDAQHVILVFPFFFGIHKTLTQDRVKLFINLVLVFVKGELLYFVTVNFPAN